MLGVRPLVTVTLAGDHRATDGATGSRLLKTIDRLLQTPGGALTIHDREPEDDARDRSARDRARRQPRGGRGGTDLRETFELDSLDFVELVERLGKRAGFRIEDDDADQLRTVDSATSFLARRSAGARH